MKSKRPFEYHFQEQMSDPINNRPKTSSGKRVQELDDFDDDDLLPE